MKNLVEILSTGPGYLKTRKIIGSLKQFFDENSIDAEFKIISESEEHVRFDALMLPVVPVNGNILARGYSPFNERILNHLI